MRKREAHPLANRPIPRLQIGKRVGGALYVHVSALAHLADHIGYKVQEAVRQSGLAPDADFNVVKIWLSREKVGLLKYRRFFEDAFPALETARTVDLLQQCVRRRRYGPANPPVLHRKELLLEPTHPRVSEYKALTEAAENAALFDQPATIGFKQQWEQRLEQAGLRVEGHRLVPAGNRAENSHVSRSKV